MEGKDGFRTKAVKNSGGLLQPSNVAVVFQCVSSALVTLSWLSQFGDASQRVFTSLHLLFFTPYSFAPHIMTW